MRKIVVFVSLLFSAGAFADLRTQMNNLQGDWDGGKNVIRVVKESDNEVVLYRCDRNAYYNSIQNICNYDFKFKGIYRKSLDAFYFAKAQEPDPSRIATGVCAFSIYYDNFYSADLNMTYNPYKLNNGCSEMGTVEVWSKIQN